jgi:putative ABC transport system permease protein
MGLSVMERTREIAVLRSLGGQDGVVRRMVVGEGVLIALISWFASIPASIPIGMKLGDALGVSLLSRPLTYGFSYSAAAIWLGLVILIAIFSSLAPSANAVKLTVRDALARE